jgi:hypothetical protein
MPTSRDHRRRLDLVAGVEREYLASHPYRLIHHYDMRAGLYTVRVEVARPLPAELSDLIDDVVREATALLDDLARALERPPDESRPSRFPIHDSVQAFAQRARRSLARMSDEAQAAIEALQPYHRLGGPRGDPLWLLRELGGAEGRQLAAGAVTGGMPMGVNTKRKVEISGDPEPRRGAFESGALIASVQAKVVGPDPKLDMHLQPTFALAFARTGPAQGAPVVATLEGIVDYVEDDVLGALGRFAIAR